MWVVIGGSAFIVALIVGYALWVRHDDKYWP